MDLGSFSFLFSYQKNCGLFGIVRLLCRFNRVSLLCWCFLITRVSQVGPNLLWLLNGFLWPLCVRKWKTFKSSWVLEYNSHLNVCFLCVCGVSLPAGWWCWRVDPQTTPRPTATSTSWPATKTATETPRAPWTPRDGSSWYPPIHSDRLHPPDQEVNRVSSPARFTWRRRRFSSGKGRLCRQTAFWGKKTKIVLTLNLLWAETAARAKASQQTIPPSPLPPVFFFFSGPFIYCGMT